MKRLLILLPLLCTGCSKWMNIGGTASPSGHNYLIIGQSNADMFYTNGGVMELNKKLTEYNSYPNTYLNCAVGGTSIVRWIPSGDLYQQAIQQAQGHKIDRVFFWQGETDVQLMSTSQWIMDFEAMVSDLRKQFPGVQIYYARLTANALDANYIYWGIMHDDMTNLPGATMISTDGIPNDPMPFRPDNPHYDSTGYGMVADRLALALMGRN